jgi:competence protein ComEC
VHSKLQFIAAFLMQEIGKQRKSLFLWLPIAMGTGIVTYFQTDIAVSWREIILAIGALSYAAWKSRSYYYSSGRVSGALFLMLSLGLLCFVSGFSSIKYRTDSLGTPILEKDTFVTMEAEIEKLVALEGGKAKRVVLRHIKPIDDRDQSLQVKRVRLKTYHFKGDEWGVGDVVHVKAKLMAPSAPVIPGGFDFRVKAYYDGISAVGFTIADATLIRKNGAKTDHVQAFRDHVRQRLYTVMNARYAAIAQALLTGERDGITKQDTQNLRTSGLAHLLAISGLHVGLVAGCVFFFIRLFLVIVPGIALRYPVKKWAAGCAIAVAFFYMVLAGATVPTMRAFIMTSLVLLAVILDRSTLNMRLVALAAIIVMITTPEAVMGPSFVLSFAAVSALIVFYQGVGRQWIVNANAYKPLWRPIYYVVGVIMTTLVATVSTAPFSIMFFNQFAVYSVLSNIFAMPLMAFIVMPFGLLSLIMMPVGLDVHIWSLVEWGIQNITMIAQSVSNYEGASLPMPSLGVIEIFLMCFGFVWLVVWRGVLRFVFVPIMVCILIFSQFDRSKYVLISEDMKSIMIVDKSVDNVFLIGRINSYTKKQWLGSLGIKNDVNILKYNIGDKFVFTGGYCDDLMCNIDFGRDKAAIIYDPIMISKACEYADIVISRTPVHDTKQCPNTRVIDRFDVWKRGAVLITLSLNEFIIKYSEN